MSALAVEDTEVDTGEGTWTSFLVAVCTAVVHSRVAGTVAAAAVAASFAVAAAVAASFAVAAVVEPSWPSAHWWMVLCCLTLKMGRLLQMDLEDFVRSFQNHTLHFVALVSSLQFHLHTSYQAIAC